MAPLSLLPSAIAIILSLQALLKTCVAQNVTLPSLQAAFGVPFPVNGLMTQTTATYPDGFTLEILSPTNRTLTVTPNPSPLPAQFITGATGDSAVPFIALSPTSYIVNTSQHANDLIALIAIPYVPASISSQGVQAANTYVAVLAPDKRSWIINDSTRNIQRSANRTRIEKLTSVAGEYLLVGRQSNDMGNIFVNYGTGVENTVRLVGGVGIQEAEFMDGLRVSVQSNTTIDMTVELNEGINPGTLNDGITALNTFMWVVRTSNPDQVVDAKMLFPFNREMLVRMHPNGASPTMMLQVGRRPLNATSGTFLPFNEGRQTVRELPEDRIIVEGVTELDGQYIMMVHSPKNIG